MLKISLLLLFSSICLNSSAQVIKKIDFLKEGDYIPEFKIPIQNEDTILSSNLKGKTIVLVFFATWCSPCLKELPHIQKEIWDIYNQKSDFELFIIGREHTFQELNAFKIKNNYDMPFIADTNRTIFSIFAKQNIPRMYLIDNKGKIIKMNKGYESNQFKQFTESLHQQLTN